MSTPLRIEVTEKARIQILAAEAWWAENRPLAPNAILEELDSILGLLRVQPGIGVLVRRLMLPGVRRVTLFRIRYCLYYRVAGDVLYVLAFWHTRRGSGPPI